MRRNKGFSIVEFIFAVVIATIIVMAITLFARDILSINTSAQSSLTAILESRKILSVMVKELRSTAPSALGSYPIEEAATSTIIFFADVDEDDVADRVRYFLDPVTRDITRGVIIASGDPPDYAAAETFSTLMTDVGNATTTPIFDYYSGAYTGSGIPLLMPIDIPLIRLVKITIDIVSDPNKSSGARTITSDAALRNLKDNL